MLYLVTGRFIEGSVTSEEFPQVWEHAIRPSLESLAKMADEKSTFGAASGIGAALVGTIIASTYTITV